MDLAAGIEVPEDADGAAGRDRLGRLASWWGAVSAHPKPERVLTWSLTGAAADPAMPPLCAARLVAPGGEPPAGVGAALAWGAALADDAVDGGADLVVLCLPPELPGSDGGPATGEPGAAELPVHALLAAHLLELDPVEATEWPGEDGLTELAWASRVAALRDRRRQLRGVYGEPERLLELLGGHWLAAGVGLLARATARRTPALLDGAPAAACALLVRRAQPAARSWWQAADSGDALHDRVLAELRLAPLLQLGLDAVPRDRFRGAGGRLALAVLEASLPEGAGGPAAGS